MQTIHHTSFPWKSQRNNSKFAPYTDNITAVILATLLLRRVSYTTTELRKTPLLLCCFLGFLVGKELGCLSGCLDDTWRIGIDGWILVRVILVDLLSWMNIDLRPFWWTVFHEEIVF